MNYSSLANFLGKGRATLEKGPIGIILAEDATLLAETVEHHIRRGFSALLVLGADDLLPGDDLPPNVHHIVANLHRPNALTEVLNPIVAAMPTGVWGYYCYNAEFLFHPFCETRTVREMLAFHTEERRFAMLAYTIDLYAGDLGTHPSGVDPEGALFDKAGYYALQRTDGNALERQYDFHGGLRWRFEEHIPQNRRKIDRSALFRAKPGLEIRADHTFNDPEYNTYSCPWHHNLTCAIASFRVAKALKFNPGSTFDIHRFDCVNSETFAWNSQQLMDLGMMEPGQWF